MVVILRLMWAYFRVFWGPTTLQNPAMELKSLLYVLVWVREQNRAFILEFWVICNSSPMGGNFSPFCSHTPTPHPPNCIIELCFVVHSFATFSSKVTKKKTILNKEFGSFLFFIFSISLKCSFWGLCGPTLGYFEVLQPYRILLWSWIPRNMFWCGYGNKTEPSYRTVE